MPVRSPISRAVGHAVGSLLTPGEFSADAEAAFLAAYTNSAAPLALQSRGAGTATASTGATSHWVPDYEGVYQEFIDEPVWVGGRVTGTAGSRVVYATETDGTPINKPRVSNGGTWSGSAWSFSNTDDWTGNDAQATISVESGQLRVTNGDASQAIMSIAMPLIVGRTYRIKGSTGTCDPGANVSVGTTAGGTDMFAPPANLAQNTDFQYTFVATATTGYLNVKPNSSLISKFSSLEYVEVAQDAPSLQYSPASTDSALHNRDLTNAAWTKTNVTAAKNATGADGSANGASTLTATAGNGTVIQQVIAASGNHAFAPLVKRKTGTGAIEITTDNGGTWTAITSDINDQVFTPVATDKAAITNPQFGFRIVTSGDEIEVDFAGLYLNSALEEVQHAPVIETGAAGDSISRSDYGWDESNWKETQGLLFAKFYPLFDYYASGASTQIFTPTTGNYPLYLASNGVVAAFDGVASSSTTYTGYVANDLMTLAMAYGGTTFVVGNDGTYDATPATYDGTFGPVTKLTLGFGPTSRPFRISDIQIYRTDYDASRVKGLELMR